MTPLVFVAGVVGLARDAAATLVQAWMLLPEVIPLWLTMRAARQAGWSGASRVRRTTK